MEQERQRRGGGLLVLGLIGLLAASNGAIGPDAELVVDNVFSELGRLLQDLGREPPDA